MADTEAREGEPVTPGGEPITPGNATTNNVTRVEVIDQNGRSYVNWHSNNRVELSLQDKGRTLKVFIKREETPAKTIE